MIPRRLRALAARAARAARFVVDALGGICDSPTRLPARVYLALWVECPCCLFNRGVALGFLLGLVVSAAIAALLLL